MLKYYWCEQCGIDKFGFKDCRWSSEETCRFCPRCMSSEIRRTMTPKEAKNLGLLDRDDDISECCSVEIIRGRCSDCKEGI